MIPHTVGIPNALPRDPVLDHRWRTLIKAPFLVASHALVAIPSRKLILLQNFDRSFSPGWILGIARMVVQWPAPELAGGCAGMGAADGGPLTPGELKQGTVLFTVLRVFESAVSGWRSAPTRRRARHSLGFHLQPVPATQRWANSGPTVDHQWQAP